MIIRPTSPDKLKASRTLNNIRDEFAGGVEKLPQKEFTGTDDIISTLRPVSVGGRHAEERIRKRAFNTYQNEHAEELSRLVCNTEII